VLDYDVLHDFKCENCSKPFVVLTKECAACSAETTFVWPESQNPETLSALQCGNCGKLVHPADELEPDE
jgi:uncharacterized OB-fold protein